MTNPNDPANQAAINPDPWADPNSAASTDHERRVREQVRARDATAAMPSPEDRDRAAQNDAPSDEQAMRQRIASLEADVAVLKGEVSRLKRDVGAVLKGLSR
jgi:hypothetical protein